MGEALGFLLIWGVAAVVIFALLEDNGPFDTGVNVAIAIVGLILGGVLFSQLVNSDQPSPP